MKLERAHKSKTLRGNRERKTRQKADLRGLAKDLFWRYLSRTTTGSTLVMRAMAQVVAAILPDPGFKCQQMGVVNH